MLASNSELFLQTWCGPCKMIAPIYANLSTKYEKSTTFLKVDVDKDKVAARFHTFEC